MEVPAGRSGRHNVTIRTMTGPLPGAMAAKIAEQFPGRHVETSPETGLPRKPKATETPFRSIRFWTTRRSSDGNYYRPGDPIWAEDAARQGQDVLAAGVDVEPQSPRVGQPPVGYERCGRCYASGRIRRLRGHDKRGHSCAMCRCPRCGGSGRTLVESPA